MSKKYKPKLADIRKKQQKAYDAAITFCFEPTQARYNMIIASPNIKVRDDLDFEAWNMAIAYSYGFFEDHEIEGFVPDEAELTLNPYANEFHEYTNSKAIKMVDCEKLRGMFEPMDAELSATFLEKPSRSKAIRCISIYYALGELKYIDMFYQLMGHSQLHADTRIFLTAGFREIREIYVNKVNELLVKNKDHFKYCHVNDSPPMKNVDFSYFTDMEAKIKLLKDQKNLDFVAADNVVANANE